MESKNTHRFTRSYSLNVFDEQSSNFFMKKFLLSVDKCQEKRAVVKRCWPTR